jgi:predicted PurR-regulated permease PerM
MNEALHALAEYVKAQLRNAAIVTCLYILGLAIAGVPWWLLVGLVCGLLQLIPYLGSVTALALAVMVRWFAGGDWKAAALVGAVWLAIQLVDGLVLSPMAAGRAGVNPFLSILITLAAGIMFGPLGVMLAVPVVAVILVLARAGKGAPR